MSTPLKVLRLTKVKPTPRKTKSPASKRVKGTPKPRASEKAAKPPTMADLKAHPSWQPRPPCGKVTRIDDWCVTGADQLMCEPNTPDSHLMGVATNHQVHPDGTNVRSSQIQGKRGEHLVTYTGSVYELGTVMPFYEEHYGPDARARLLASLREVEA